METKYFSVDPVQPEANIIKQAAGLLRRGELVAFPTETVYGLGVNAISDEAILRLFKVKERPLGNPLTLHLAALEAAEGFVAFYPEKARKLAAAFWPGPLTLLLPAAAAVNPLVNAGSSRVGVRVPDHPVALALLAATGVPVVATSANRSGRLSPTTAAHVREDLDGRIECVLDAGATGFGVESTVVDVGNEPPLVVRPGAITLEMLQKEVPVLLHPELAAGKPVGPAAGYHHYRPRAQLLLVTGEPEQVVRAILRLAGEYRYQGKRVTVMGSEENAAAYRESKGVHMEVLGSWTDLKAAAARLFTVLRACDRAGADIILAEIFPPQGFGLTINNRLSQAGRTISAEHVLEVES